jgi:hypothetical protein
MTLAEGIPTEAKLPLPSKPGSLPFLSRGAAPLAAKEKKRNESERYCK